MLLCFFRRTKKGTSDNGYFYLLPDAPSAFLSWSGAYLAPMAFNPFGIGLSRMIL